MNGMRRPAGIGVGAWVRFGGQVRTVTAVTTTTVKLTETDGPVVVVELDALLKDEDFAVVDIPVRQPLPAASFLETFPKAVMEKALWWEGHILEVLHGLPPTAEPGTRPRPGSGPRPPS
ncbi:hypothetical protein GCM10027160_17540 [Streptomyces calidiresistens]|uniref:hypothetical protein n=1 Tax=Streptomyces calidiresistens TaxID=1485586 RepID=UPI001E3371F9|nr:hypothetical protein [Streptomyces calidiresistens]